MHVMMTAYDERDDACSLHFVTHIEAHFNLSDTLSNTVAKFEALTSDTMKCEMSMKTISLRVIEFMLNEIVSSSLDN